MTLDTAQNDIAGMPLGIDEQTGIQESLHASTWTERLRVIDALWHRWNPSLQKLARRLASCCSGAAFFVEPHTGKVRPWINRCGSRLCPFCAVARTARVSAELTAILMAMKNPRAIVLTLRSNDRPLPEQLRILRANFRRLRARKAWKGSVRAGAYTVEITYNAKTGQWHPHLHIVYDGDYLHHETLRGLWHTITGDSNVIWISKVTDRAGAARELAKYIGKPQHVHTLSPENIGTYAHAVRHERLVQTFGALHGKKVHDTDKVQPVPADTYSVKLSTLVRLARRGWPTPAKLLVAIAAQWPLFADYIYHAIPNLTEPVDAATKYRALMARIRGSPRTNSQLASDAMDRPTAEARTHMLFGRYRQEREADTFDTVDLDHPATGLAEPIETAY